MTLFFALSYMEMEKNMTFPHALGVMGTRGFSQHHTSLRYGSKQNIGKLYLEQKIFFIFIFFIFFPSSNIEYSYMGR